MPTQPEDFAKRLARLRSDLTEQGRRVQALVESAFDSAFHGDPDAAQRVIDLDDAIDRADVQIERASVQLLADATASSAPLPADQLRLVLTIVKVNNELERVADAGVSIASRVRNAQDWCASLPVTFRVLANSVVGIIRDANGSLERLDARLAQLVLASEDAVLEFRAALLRDVQQASAENRMSADLAFSFHEIATYAEIMADHCTNIAEQVLYVATGAIYRHAAGRWEQAPLPGS